MSECYGLGWPSTGPELPADKGKVVGSFVYETVKDYLSLLGCVGIYTTLHVS